MLKRKKVADFTKQTKKYKANLRTSQRKEENIL